MQTAFAQAVPAGADHIVEQRAKEKRGGHARGVHHGGAITESNTNDACRHRCVQSCERAIGKIAVPQRDEGEHAVAHGERHRDGGGDETAEQLVAQSRRLQCLDEVHLAYWLPRSR